MATRRFAACGLGILSLVVSGCAFTTIRPATGVTNHSAILQGGIASFERTTGEYRFEWGKTTAYEGPAFIMPVRFLPDTEVAAVAAPIAHLEAGVTYHYRLCAKNDGPGDRFCGRDATFVTPNEPPAAPKVYMVESCALDGSPYDFPSYAVLGLTVGLPAHQAVQTLLMTGDIDRGATGNTTGADGVSNWGGFGPAVLGGSASVRTIEDLDGDAVQDPGEAEYARGSIDDICSDFPQAP